MRKPDAVGGDAFDFPLPPAHPSENTPASLPDALSRSGPARDVLRLLKG